MKCSRRGWTVILCMSVSIVMVMQSRASPVDRYPTQAPHQARYEQTDEYDKYVFENGLAARGDMNNDVRELAELFDEINNVVDDVDRNAHNSANDRSPLHGPVRPPPSRPGSMDRIMGSLYNSFGGPALRSMIEQYTRSGYSGGAGAEYGGDECCKYDVYTIIPGFVLVAVSYLLLILLNATVTGGKRRRRDAPDAEDSALLNRIADNVMLDGPTWLSMVHELWEQDDSPENMACIQETLCRMNRLAMAAPGQAGWAVSLSSLPLSYLLHARHTGGFTSYVDAALMGRSGANCTELYSSCPRLQY